MVFASLEGGRTWKSKSIWSMGILYFLAKFCFAPVRKAWKDRRPQKLMSAWWASGEPVAVHAIKGRGASGSGSRLHHTCVKKKPDSQNTVGGPWLSHCWKNSVRSMTSFT